MEIKKNQEYKVEITGMTHEGQGVGRIDGFAVFVDGALPGETVDIKLIKVNKNYGVGKLLSVANPAASRVEPFCPAYKSCGGCSLQHMSYEAQLRFKTDLVKDNLQRIGKLQDVVVHDTIGMENPFSYRNKAQYPVGICGGQPAAGFYARRSHRIIESDSCGIQDEASSEIKKLVYDFILSKGISVYDEVTGKGLVRHIMTRVGFKTGEIMVVLVINGADIPCRSELIKEITETFPAVKSIYLSINTRNTNVIMGEKNVRIFGDEFITDLIGDLRFRISPLSFFQVNPVQTEVLYGKALKYAGLTGNETVFDLYCGIGTITLFLARKAKKVYGVEVVEDAIRDARENAKLNGIENVEFAVGEAETVIPEMYARGIRADVVVVDPPRKGCDPSLLDTLVDMRPERIVYVSCNPSTLARDLGILEEKGFNAVEAQPVDMFPWTAHVEVVVLLLQS